MMTASSANQPFVSSLRMLAKISSGGVIAVGALVLLGWALDVTLLKSVVPGLVAMNPLTAVGFIAAGSGLAGALTGERAAGFAQGCALLVAAIGATIFVRYLFGWDAGVDRLLFAGSLGVNVMAPSTSLVFVLSGAALFLLSREAGGALIAAQILALLTALIALLALTGYAYGSERLYRISGFIAMALHTAACFLTLAIGLLCGRPDRAIIARLAGIGPGGALLRRLLLPVIGFPLALGALLLTAHRTGWIDAPFAIALCAIALIVFVLAMLGRSAWLLDRKDAERTRAEEALRRAHEGLETAVENRTGELRQVIETILKEMTVLSTAAEEIFGSASQLAAAAAETATSVAESTTTVSQVRHTAQHASEQSQRVATSARKAAGISHSGKGSAEAAAAGMQRIQQEMQTMAESMARLNEQGHAIGEIIAAVEDISEQSSLLAVNAAIQAATAGEHGKGFAVVADEVKYLSGQSRDATAQVRAILRDIQQAAARAVLTTEHATKAVEAGARASAGAGESIADLAEHIDGAAQVATQIAASSQQQLIGMDQVALAMEQIHTATTQNAEETRQLEESVRNLNALGQRLKELVERYKPATAQ